MVSFSGRGLVSSTGLAVLLASQIVSGKLLDDPPACDNTIVEIANKTDIDFYKSCPVISSTLFFIDHDFKGPFDLPGVQSIPKLSSGYLGPALGNSDRTDDGVTTVSMPDLRNVSNAGVLFGYLQHLSDVSLPKLESIAIDLAIVGNPNLRNLSFPSLATIGGGVYLDGDFDSIDLPSLKSVGYLKIESSGNLSCPALGRALANLTFTQNDFGQGLTCYAGQGNHWNSSDPKHNPKGNGSDPSDADGSNDESAASTLFYSSHALAMVAALCFLL